MTGADDGHREAPGDDTLNQNRARGEIAEAGTQHHQYADKSEDKGRNAARRIRSPIISTASVVANSGAEKPSDVISARGIIVTAVKKHNIPMACTPERSRCRPGRDVRNVTGSVCRRA